MSCRRLSDASAAVPQATADRGGPVVLLLRLVGPVLARGRATEHVRHRGIPTLPPPVHYSGGARLFKLRLLAALVAMASLQLLAACGDDEEATGTTSGGSGAAADLARYCELSRQLDQEGRAFFEKLEKQGSDVSRADFRAAERKFLEENQSRIHEVVRVAPSEIEADVRTFVDGLRARAGVTEGEVDQESINAADQRLNAFEEENCPA